LQSAGQALDVAPPVAERVEVLQIVLLGAAALVAPGLPVERCLVGGQDDSEGDQDQPLIVAPVEQRG
jgi:hypothetical protein